MGISEIAANIIAGEIQKSQADLDDALQNLREAQARVEVAEIKLNSLKAALDGTPPRVAGPPERISAAEAVPADTPKTRQFTGFRDAIRDVLAKSAGKGLTSRSVWERLSECGVTYAGTIDPVTRTGNELRMLVKKGEARKRGSNFYCVPTATDSNMGDPLQ